jgi:hypothetical protein
LAPIIEAYRNARTEIARWQDAAEVLRRRIEQAMGDADEGIIHGRRVVSYRRDGAFKSAQFMTEQKELAEKYSRPKSGTEIDTDRLREDFPELYSQYRTRPFVLQ